MEQENKIITIRTESIFRITSKYEDRNNLIQETGVVLIMNYTDKTFRIVPLGQTSTEFKFLNLKENNCTAKLVAQCISKAIDFANEQLKLHEFSESNIASN